MEKTVAGVALAREHPGFESYGDDDVRARVAALERGFDGDFRRRENKETRRRAVDVRVRLEGSVEGDEETDVLRGIDGRSDASFSSRDARRRGTS